MRPSYHKPNPGANVPKIALDKPRLPTYSPAMRKLAAIVSVLAIASLVFGASFYSENVTGGAAGAATVTLSNFAAASQVRVEAYTTGAVYVKYAPDMLVNGDFEDSFIAGTLGTTGVAIEPTVGYPDAWDDSDNLLTWGWTENTVTIEEETTNEIYDRSSLRFESSGVAQLIANDDLELLSGDNFTSWTENVNGGSGTITSIETGMYELLEAAELTGGTAHVDLESATTVVVAGTAYVLSVWGDVTAAGDLLDIRVQEVTGGSNFLQTNGTWAAGEADVCTSTVFDEGTNGTYTQCVVEFTTAAGITGLLFEAAVDVSADVGRVDGWSLHVKDNTVVIQATSKLPIFDTAVDGYVCAFTQDAASTASARVEYAIISPSVANPIVKRYYTGSAWTNTETWISSAYNATATQTRAYFEADSTDGHFLQFRIRPETMGNVEDIYIDKVFCTEVVRLAGDGMLLGIAGDSYVFDIEQPGGRFSVIGSGIIVNFTAIK